MTRITSIHGLHATKRGCGANSFTCLINVPYREGKFLKI